MLICRVVRFALQGLKSIRIAELISYKRGYVQVQSSLVIPMKLSLRIKVGNGDDDDNTDKDDSSDTDDDTLNTDDILNDQDI